MALMTYLLKDRNGTYYFRRVIPPALRAHMPEPWRNKANWKRTLGTKNPAEAKVAAASALSECTADFLAAERRRIGDPKPTPAQTIDATSLNAAEIEADVLRELLSADDAERIDGDARRQLQTPEDRSQWPNLTQVEFSRLGMMDDHWYAYGESLSELHAEYKKALARSDPSIVNAETQSYFRTRGQVPPKEARTHYDAGLAVLRAHVRAYGLMLERQRGEIVTAPAPTPAAGPKLSEAFEKWKVGGKAQGATKPSDRTIMEADHAVRRFREWHGDLRLGEITREKAREFRDALAQVPTRLPRAVLNLPLRELLKRKLPPLPKVHAATVNKSLQLLSAVVSNAIREGAMDRNPTFANPFDKGIKFAIDKRSAEARQIFEDEDLKSIFGSRIYTMGLRPEGGGGEAAFWLPLIALLTGARQGELAELRIGDLRQDNETQAWFFDISTEGGRSIKTAASRRKVPLHSKLLDAGLLRYRQALIDSGAKMEAPLWPDIISDSRGRRAGPWSKWFNRFLRTELKITERGKVFHSFRHTFKRLARDAALSEEIHDALTGHSGGGVGRSYGGGFGIKALAAALDQIVVPKGALLLKWTPGVGFLVAKPPRKPRVKKIKLTPPSRR